MYALPSGKRLHNYGTSPCSMGKSTISMAMASIALQQSLPEGIVFVESSDWILTANTHPVRTGSEKILGFIPPGVQTYAAMKTSHELTGYVCITPISLWFMVRK